MSKIFRANIVVLSIVTLLFFVIGLSQLRWPAVTSSNTVTTNISTTCQVRGQLPDPVCTPGAVDPAITQENIQTTICVSGYTKTVRPPTSVTNPIKEERMRAYGVTGSKADFELDHLIPLTIGGAPSSTENLWPETYLGQDGARKKDALENSLNNLVCNGAVPLRVAQQAIATDWLTAYRQYLP